MNGPEHYREAERLLAEVGREQPPNLESIINPVYHASLRAEMLTQAQVHATLAHAAATIDAGNAIVWTGASEHQPHEVANSVAWAKVATGHSLRP